MAERPTPVHRLRTRLADVARVLDAQEAALRAEDLPLVDGLQDSADSMIAEVGRLIESLPTDGGDPDTADLARDIGQIHHRYRVLIGRLTRDRDAVVAELAHLQAAGPYAPSPTRSALDVRG